MPKVRVYLFSFAWFFCGMVMLAQHSNQVTATLDDTNKVLQVRQDFTYVNNSDQVLSVLYFNDWNHSYSNKNTALTKRFGNEFNRSLHLAKFKERGRTQITTAVDKQYRGLNWERTGKRDIIRIILNEPLEPGGSAQIFLTYTIKLPNNKFTGYGYTNEGEYFLENWYLSPAVFSNSEWNPYSNKNLNDIYTDVCNTTVNLIFPPELFFASNYAFETSSQFPGGQQITVKGNQRKNCVVHLTRQREYVIHKTRAMTLTSNLQGGSKYDPSFRSVSIDKVTSFLYDNLGDYPHDNLLVSELDYNRSPLYGLSQLPSFIRPYKEQFQFEMAFLKTALDNYLKESLYLDPRKDQWVFHAIANYLTIKYVEENYPNQKLTGQLSRIWGLRSYHFSQMHFNDQYYYLQMASVRRNDHQALATPNDSLTRWNHKIANRYKAGLGMAYLAEYIGYDKLEAAIKEFYAENKLTPGVSAEQLKQKLTEKTDLDINWFFDEYVALRNNIDFKITEVSKENDSISFTIKNKTGSNVPISLFGLQKDSVISKYWFSDIDSTKTYAIPDNNETRLVLNYDQKIPEVNQGNNWKNVNGFLSNKKLQFRFLQDTENPFFNQIFYVPEFNFNVNDGLSGGISFKNKPLLIRKPFIYQIKPRYSTKEQTIVGSAGFSYQEFFNEGKLNSITYSFSGRSSFFDTNSRFNTLTPAVSFNWRPEDFVSNRRQFLLFRLRNVFRNIDDEIIDQIDTEPDFTVFNVRYGDVDNNILRFRSWVVDGQLSGNFSKLSFEWEQRTLFNNNRQLNLRFYAGKFITNTSNSDFFSFALDRPTDYLFDLDYLNRSQSASGLSSQQFILAEGGFKSIFDDRFGNDWIATGNLSFNVWQWIELYGDIGAIRNRGEDARFLYGYGVRLNLVTDFFELYFPIYSNNGYEIAQPNYGERIRFVVTISPKTLTRLFTRKWF